MTPRRDLACPLPGMERTRRLLSTTLARQVEAEEALHNSDPGPRLANSSAWRA